MSDPAPTSPFLLTPRGPGTHAYDSDHIDELLKAEDYRSVKMLIEKVVWRSDCPYKYQARHFFTMAIISEDEKERYLGWGRRVIETMELTRGGLGSAKEIQLCKDYEQWALRNGARRTPEVVVEDEDTAMDDEKEDTAMDVGNGTPEVADANENTTMAENVVEGPPVSPRKRKLDEFNERMGGEVLSEDNKKRKGNR